MSDDQYTIRPATPDDLDAVLALRREAEQWLADNGIRQWTADYDEYAVGVLTAWVEGGAAWVVEHDGQVVATASLNAEPDPDFWGWLQIAHQATALYLGKMIVRRDHAGLKLGDAIMNWACGRVKAAGRTWLRLDVRRDNRRLQHYYVSRGFRWMGTRVPLPPRVTESGWLGQRNGGQTTQCPITLIEIEPSPSARRARDPATSRRR